MRGGRTVLCVQKKLNDRSCFFLFYKQVFGRSYVAQVESFKQKKNGQKSRDTLPLKTKLLSFKL